MISTLVLFIIGVVLLIVGADVLVRGASTLAIAVGISPLVVGLTVVAFGTSSPELAVLVQASVEGQSDIAIGNVVGSNICNILIVFGLTALIAPLVVSRQAVRIDVPIMIGASFLLLLLVLDLVIGRFDGIILFGGIVAYTIWSIRQSQKQNNENNGEKGVDGDEPTPEPPSLKWAKDVAFIVAGLVMLTVGARWLVDGAVTFATWLGVSELIIGLTVVAVGTSLPEIATSVIAGMRGEGDLVVGNVIGSNIFNILMVLGLTSIISPIDVSPQALHFDIPVMIAVALLSLPVLYTSYRVKRWEGGLFVMYYIAYTVYLILDVKGYAAPLFVNGMTIVVSVTFVLFFAMSIKDARAKRSHTV